MIVMAPADEEELVHMVATAAHIDDRPVCFRYPRGAIVGTNAAICSGIPIEVVPRYNFYFLTSGGLYAGLYNRFSLIIQPKISHLLYNSLPHEKYGTIMDVPK